MVGIAVADDFGRRRHDGDTIADGFQQALAAGEKVGVGHAFLNSASSSARRCGVPTSTQRPVKRSPVKLPVAMAASSSGRSFMMVPGLTSAKKPAKNSNAGVGEGCFTLGVNDAFAVQAEVAAGVVGRIRHHDQMG